MFNPLSIFSSKKEEVKTIEVFEKSSDSFGIDVPTGMYGQEISATNVVDTFSTLVYVRSAIGILQDSISQIPVKILREDADGELVELYRVRDPAFRKDLFSAPNPFFTYDEYISDIILNYCLYGNAFTTLEIDGGKAETYSIDPTKMRIVPDKRNYIKQYEYGNGTSKVIYVPRQIGHIRTRSLSGIYFGQSPIETISNELNTLLYQNKFLLDYFKNSARPDGVLVTDNFLSPTIKDKIRAEWNRLHSFFGSNAGKVAILSNGLRYEKIQDSLSDVNVDKLDNFLARRVATAFRIPMLFFANSENVNFSTSTNVIKIYYRMAVRPIISRIEDRLTRLVQGYFNDNKLHVKFQLHGLPGLVEDLETYAKTLGSLKDAGIVSANEARKMLNQVVRVNLDIRDDEAADELVVRGSGSARDAGQPQQSPDKPRREGTDNTNSDLSIPETLAMLEELDL